MHQCTQLSASCSDFPLVPPRRPGVPDVPSGGGAIVISSRVDHLKPGKVGTNTVPGSQTGCRRRQYARQPGVPLHVPDVRKSKALRLHGQPSDAVSIVNDILEIVDLRLDETQRVPSTAPRACCAGSKLQYFVCGRIIFRPGRGVP